jgi:hypothetical protein
MVGPGTTAAGTPTDGTRSHGPAMAVGLGAEPRARRANTVGDADPHAGPSDVDPPPPPPHPAAEAGARVGGGSTEHEVPPPDDARGVGNNDQLPGGAGGATNPDAPSGGAGGTAGEGVPCGDVPSRAAGGSPVPGSRARPQPSAAPDPARGRQTAPSASRSSQPHRSGNRTLAEALAAASAMTRYPPPLGTQEYEAWREELHTHLEFARGAGGGSYPQEPQWRRRRHHP